MEKDNLKNEQQCAIHDVTPRCIYCNGVATDKMYLFSVSAPGAYWQHWDLKNQRGCSENKENISPNGEFVNVV